MITPISDRPREAKILTDGLLDGFSWIYGLHGIGKTSLVKEVTDNTAFNKYKFIYLDSRTEIYSFSNITQSILNGLQLDFSDNEKVNYNLLRLYHKTISPERYIRVIIDELDVYPPRQIQPVWNLALAGALMNSRYTNNNFGFLFISARPPSYFEDPDDLGSKPTMGEVQLYPLSIEATFRYFSRIDIPKRKTHELIRLSGGNPTLMNMLSQMFIATNEINAFDVVNRNYLANMYSYFNNVWNALEEHTKWYCIYAAILFYNYANKTSHWQTLKRKTTDWDVGTLSLHLRDMLSFGSRLPDFGSDETKDIPSIVSPIFVTWVLIQKASKISQDFSDKYNGPNPLYNQNVLGLPLSYWKDASTAITTIGKATTIFQTLMSIFR